VLIEAAGWRSIYTQFGAITSLNRANEVMAILLGKYANIEAQNKMGSTDDCCSTKKQRSFGISS